MEDSESPNNITNWFYPFVQLFVNLFIHSFIFLSILSLFVIEIIGFKFRNFMVYNYQPIKNYTPVPQRFLARRSLIGGNFFSIRSPSDIYHISSRWIRYVLIDYQTSVRCVGRDPMGQNRPIGELSAELSSPSDAISGQTSSQCRMDVELVRCLSDLCWSNIRRVRAQSDGGLIAVRWLKANWHPSACNLRSARYTRYLSTTNAILIRW